MAKKKDLKEVSALPEVDVVGVLESLVVYVEKYKYHPYEKGEHIKGLACLKQALVHFIEKGRVRAKLEKMNEAKKATT